MGRSIRYMPTKNVVKNYGENQYYHIYNRGVDKMDIFREESDYTFFLYLLKRYLSPGETKDTKGRLLPNYAESVDLIAYCLMPNHFHALVFLKQRDGLERLMRSLMTSYSRYFNRKYRRVGPLFQSRFLASLIAADAYFWHISRYIHLNPIDIGADWRTYPFSSIGYFIGARKAKWINPQQIIEPTPRGRSEYAQFVADYQDMRATLSAIKHDLANYK